MKSEQIVLSFGDYHAVVSSFGASLRRFWRKTQQGNRDICWGYETRAEKKGGQGDVLIPFPGRIPGGKYRFQGTEYHLEPNDKEGPNAIHGFVRSQEWAARFSESAAGFRLKTLSSEMSSKGYPFSLDMGVSYQLSSLGLRCEFSVQNIGATDAPVGVGFHPYFAMAGDRVDSGILRLPSQEQIEFAPGFLPTGRVLPVAGTNLDFQTPRTIGEITLNHCFKTMARDPDGYARASLLDPYDQFETQIWMNSSFDYLVVYTGEALGSDARRAIAIEPMTCGTDAFNRPDWGLTVLRPGEFLTGSWGVSGQTKL
ncbi:MAG: hypothetical protein KGQ59_11480 [Bdellovibrionales bacterium]|nr:hypothetical protein [Bdellovibrionales bacterium]